jgi:ATP-dependent DNA helicase RecG
VSNPGGLLSPMTIDDLKAIKGVHQSRNSYLARTLREVGYMRELGEGKRRIHELMKSNELTPPRLDGDGESFSLTLFHRAMYSQEEVLWLEQCSPFALSAEQKAIVLLGRKGNLVAPQDIWDRLGLVDTEHYRQSIFSLQVLGILVSERAKGTAQSISKRERISLRAMPRFRIKIANDVKQQNAKSTSRATGFSAPAPSVIKRVQESVENASLFVGNLPENVLTATC